MLNYGRPAIVALWIASSINPFLFAADPILPPSDTDLIHNRQERLLQDQQKRLDELQQLPNTSSVAKPELTDETRCFEVKEISLQGAVHISAFQLNRRNGLLSLLLPVGHTACLSQRRRMEKKHARGIAA